MRIYAMSDVHGCAKALEARLAQLQSLGFMEDGCKDELVLLGDYVDRGPCSLEVLNILMDLCKRCPGRVFPLAGNHESELLGWLGTENRYDLEDDIWPDDDRLWEDDPRDELPDTLLEKGPDLEARMLAWRMVDRGAVTMRSLLGPAGWRSIGPRLRRRSTMVSAFGEACEIIRDQRAAQVGWIRGLLDCRETDRQVFVHAGIDESLGAGWHLGTTREDMLNDRSCRRGRFVKDVVAGHTPTGRLCGDPDFHGVLWDGASHFYIDGSTPSSNVLPVLVWSSSDGSYRELHPDGSMREPRLWSTRVVEEEP